MSRDEFTQSFEPEHQLPVTPMSQSAFEKMVKAPQPGAAFRKAVLEDFARPVPIINAVITMPIALFNSDAVVLNPPLHGSVLVGKFHDEEDALKSRLITDIAELIYVWVVGENRDGDPVDQQLFVFRQEAAPIPITEAASLQDRTA